VISFHSLEDRIVKQFIAAHSKEEVDRRAPFAPPPALALKALGRIKPSAAEVAANRARARPCCAWPSAPTRRCLPGDAVAKLNLVLLLAVLASGLCWCTTPTRRAACSPPRACQGRGQRLAADAERLKAERPRRPPTCAWSRWRASAWACG
jgi:hypothetical protein